MAVTGCPEPQKNHAVIMSKFANDCLLQMNRLTGELVDKLGVDTRELGLRIGMVCT